MKKIGKVALVTAASGGVLLAGAGGAFADSGAEAAAVNSPGVLSGNNIQVPVNIPINLCGNSIDVIALLNPSFGNTCVNA